MQGTARRAAGAGGAVVTAQIVSVVDRGWRGARECSIQLAGQAVEITHVIRGRLDPEIRALIQPYPHERLIDAPRRWHVVWVWGLVLWASRAGRLRWILVDHERRLQKLGPLARAVGARLAYLEEGEHGWRLLIDGHDASPKALA